jgi:hypothetical protein
MTRRRINAIATSTRKSHTRNISQTSHAKHIQEPISGPCELDSHADTCVAGANCLVLEYTDQVCSVSAFSETHEVWHDIPIVTAATAYDDPMTGDTYILILGQAIYMCGIFTVPKPASVKWTHC